MTDDGNQQVKCQEVDRTLTNLKGKLHDAIWQGRRVDFESTTERDGLNRIVITIWPSEAKP